LRPPPRALLTTGRPGQRKDRRGRRKEFHWDLQREVAQVRPARTSSAVLVSTRAARRAMSRERPSFSCQMAPTRPERTNAARSEEHTSELQSLAYLVCRLLLEKKNASDNYGFAE